MAFTFADEAERIAYYVTPDDFSAGRTWRQTDTGMIWRPRRSGIDPGGWEEVYSALPDAAFSLPLSLDTFRIVMDAENNLSSTDFGLLHAGSDPALVGVGGVQMVRWDVGSTQAIAAHMTAPKEVNIGASDSPIYVECAVASGSTNAANLTVLVQDAFDFNATDLNDNATKSATLHTVASAGFGSDLAAKPICFLLRITPPAHATDPICLAGVRIVGRRLTNMPPAGP